MEAKDKITAVRQALNFNKKTFAKEIHVSAGYISDIESGKKEPSDSLLDLIISKWNVNEEWWESQEGGIFKKDDEILDMVQKEVRRLYDEMAAGGALVDRSKAGTVILEKLAELARG